MKYFIHQTAELLFVSFNTQESTILANFCNPKISG